MIKSLKDFRNNDLREPASRPPPNEIIPVEKDGFWGMCIRVNRWKHIATVILLTLWAACSVNCAFEDFSAAPLDCCNDTTRSSGEPVDGSSCCVCGVLVSGTYVSHGQVRMVAAPILAALVLPPFLDTDLPEPVNSPAGIDPSPPELPGTWQFVVRTALQPRAPSLVS